MPDKVEIVISMNTDGNIEVHGPLDNKILFLGMIEIAKQVMFTYNAKKTSNLITPVLAMPDLSVKS